MPFTKTDKHDAGDDRVRAAGYRRDLFKLIDIIAITPEGILGVQSTSKQQLSAHRRKIVHTDEIAEAVAAWIAARGLFRLWGWAKVGNRWQVVEQEIDVAELAESKRLAIEAGWREAGKPVQTSITF